MGFCRIWDEHVLKATMPEEKQQAVVTTIDLCIQRGYPISFDEDCLEVTPEQALKFKRVV